MSRSREWKIVIPSASMEITVKNYRIRITPAGLNGFWAEVPALPGCFTQGRSFEETEELIREAIDVHRAELRALGKNIPEDVEHDADAQYALIMRRRRGMDATRFSEILVQLGFEKPRSSGKHIGLFDPKTEKHITIPNRGIDLSRNLRILEHAEISKELYRLIRSQIPLG